MIPYNRHCIPCIDEISAFYNISTEGVIAFYDIGYESKRLDLANNVAVLIIRGFHINWKQPLVYFSVSSSLQAKDLKTLIADTIMNYPLQVS